MSTRLPPISFSLRSKLILTMALLVFLTTLANILITRHQVREAYTGLYTDQATRQIEYFISRQEERLNSLADVCERLAENPEVKASILAKNGPASYKIISDEILNAQRTDPSQGMHYMEGLAGLSGSLDPLDLAKFLEFRPEILLVDSEGKPLNGQRSGLPIRESTLRRLTRTQLEKITKGKRPRKLARQQLGFAVLEDAKTVKTVAAEPTSADSSPPPVSLAEIVATPVFDDNGANIGALLVTVPFLNVEEQLLQELSPIGAGDSILSGIWVDGVIHSRTIPEALRASLAKRLNEEIKDDTSANGEFELTLAGAPYLVNFTELNPDSPFSRACQVGIYSLLPLRKQMHTLERTIAATGLFGTAAALFVILLLSRNLTNPLRALVRATDQIRSGDYTVRVPSKTQDEVGLLSRSFNEMTAGLELTRRYQSILSQVTDKEVAQALIQGGVSLGGEEREVTVLFCDIRGFTSLTEGMPPQDIIALLNTHMTAMTEVVHHNQGTVDKFVGDMIMALFGAPKTYGNDALRAAACAMDMIQSRKELNGSQNLPVEIGIGIATGQVVAGCMGSVDRLNFTVLGEKVNLASRLCSAAGPGEIYLDEATKEQLSDHFPTKSLGNLDFKGFSENIAVWQIL